MKTAPAPEPGSPGELEILGRALEASASVSALDNFTREHILNAALAARRQRLYTRLGLAASVLLLLGSLPLLPLQGPRPLPGLFTAHPLIQDPLLTELDLLDLQLLEISRAFDTETLFPTLEELL